MSQSDVTPSAALPEKDAIKREVPFLNEERFFRGLIAALRLEGLTAIDRRNDQHHRQLERALKRTEELRTRFQEQVEELLCVFPSPFTGRYPGFDSALHECQHALVALLHSSVVTLGPVTVENLSEKLAAELLELYTGQFAQLMRAFAKLFIEEEKD